MRNIFHFVLCVVIFISFSTGAAEAKKTFTIGVCQSNLGEPWRVQMNADIKQEAEKHPEVKVIFKDAQNDTLRQCSHVQEFINSKVDIIIVPPKEGAPLTKPIADAIDAGIPVVVLGIRVLGDKYTCFIGTDNKMIGKSVGEWVKKTLKGKGNIIELKGLMTSSPGQDRHNGFIEGLKRSDIKIVFDAETNWLEPIARAEAESALARYEKIDLIFGANDPAAHGAYLAAHTVGRDKNIIFVGIDGLPQEGQAYVKQNILQASFLFPTGGKEAIEIALDILHGKKISKDMMIKSRIYTKDNVNTGGAEIN